MRSPVNYFGGKSRLQSWIREFFPDHTTYLEPFGGAGAVVLNKKPAKDYYNEIDSDMYNLMYVLKNPKLYKEFIDIIQGINYCEQYFNYYQTYPTYSKLDQAIKTYVIFRMSRGGMGKDFSNAFNRTRGGRPEKINSWETMKLELPQIHKRLQSIHLSQNNGITLIDNVKFNNTDTLIYCDSPYVKETRTSKQVYKHEFTDNDHIKLAEVCNNSQAKIIVSGYPSKLYDKLFKGWYLVEKQCKNNSGQNKIKKWRTEVLWKNF